MTVLVALILGFPLAGFLISGLGYTRLSPTITSFLAPGAVLASFLLSLIVCILPMSGNGAVVCHLFSWISIGPLTLNFDVLIDPLTKIMLLVITGIGFLIHVYSIGYMRNEGGFNRFFAFMNLFIFSMLLLVMAANYAILFIGWEGVGLCSYLLIGFWYRNHEFNNAAKKAFIMNRIGDLGFLIGIFLLFTTFGTLDFLKIFQLAAHFPSGTVVLTAITILLLIGAIGKSAQIPLYTWLPDAMAGPTPVSALIHAATMVTAGVYLVARSNILFVLAPQTMTVLVFIGLFTAIFAALIAVSQNDIKKILAYSTISQLGYMFMALGFGAFTGAMFHLITHAFFKALLFLAAGSVIHSLQGEQDIRKMGGLRKFLPVTWWTFLAGTISIAGIPPFAGYFSKEEILIAAFGKNPVIWGIAITGVILTSLYIFRMLFLVFTGSAQGSTKEYRKESPGVMIIPMIVLAGLSVVGGWINFPGFSSTSLWLSHFLSPVFQDSLAILQKTKTFSENSGTVFLGAFTTSIVLAAAFVAFKLSGKSRATGENLKPAFPAKVLIHKFYIDELYDFIIVKPFQRTSDFLYRWIEQTFIDKAVNGVGSLAVKSANIMRLLQTGHVGFYLFVMVFGIIAILLFSILM